MQHGNRRHRTCSIHVKVRYFKYSILQRWNNTEVKNKRNYTSVPPVSPCLQQGPVYLCCTLWGRTTVFSCKSTFFHLLKNTSHSYFDICTVHVLLFFTMTNKSTVNDHKLPEYNTIVSKHVAV